MWSSTDRLHSHVAAPLGGMALVGWHSSYPASPSSSRLQTSLSPVKQYTAAFASEPSSRYTPAQAALPHLGTLLYTRMHAFRSLTARPAPAAARAAAAAGGPRRACARAAHGQAARAGSRIPPAACARSLSAPARCTSCSPARCMCTARITDVSKTQAHGTWT